jgi:hypothetical protein
VFTNTHRTVSPGEMSIALGDEPSSQVADVSVQPSGVSSATEWMPGSARNPGC